MSLLLQRVANRLPELTVAALLFFAFALGIWARFTGLATAPLIDDEYYLAKSIFNVMNTGLPEFETGGYYTRGLIQQYLTAALLMTGVEMEFGLRLLPAVCGSLCVVPVFLLARKSGGSVVAWATVALFLLSLWETEFSRFARMYAPFQLLFLCYMLFWLRAVVDGCMRSLYTCAVLAIIGIFVYAASLLLLLFCLIPVFLHTRVHVGGWATLAVFGLAGFAYTQYGIVYPTPVVPDDLQSLPQVSTNISAILPAILAPLIMSSKPFAVFYVLLLIVLIYMGYRIWQQRHVAIAIPMLLSAALLFVALNLMLLATVASILALLLELNGPDSWREIWNKYGLYVLPALVAGTLLYSTFLTLSADWYGQISQISVKQYPQKPAQALAILLNYPDVLARFVVPLLRATPLTLLALSLGAMLATLHCLVDRKQETSALRYLFFMLVICVLFVSVTGAHQRTTRYSFFFYPLLIVIAVSGLNWLFSVILPSERVKQVAMLFCVLSIVFFTDDYRIKHLMNISSKTAIYRQALPPALATHLLPRRDFRSPVEYINQNREVSDIVVSATTPTDIYLNSSLDYMYIPYTAHRFWERNVSGSGKDVWSDAQMLYKPESVHSLIAQRKQTIWLLVFSVGWDGQADSEFGPVYAANNLAYQSEDHTIAVYKFPLPQN